MSENQLADYAKIATQQATPNEQYDPTKGLIDRLQMLAIKPQEEKVLQRGNEIVQHKTSAEQQAEHARIDAETRAMFQDMKQEHAKDIREFVIPTE